MPRRRTPRRRRRHIATGRRSWWGCTWTWWASRSTTWRRWSSDSAWRQMSALSPGVWWTCWVGTPCRMTARTRTRTRTALNRASVVIITGATAQRKMAKYGQLAHSFIRFHTSCRWNSGTDQQRWSRVSQRPWKAHFSNVLFQRLSVLIQRFNAVAIQGTFAHTPTEDDVPAFSSCNFCF